MIAHAVMRGSSMHPLLREGMLLEVDRVPSKARIGKIAVFHSGGRLVAHRVVRRRGDTLICSGDAQPDRLDVVPQRDLLGFVRAVYRREAEGLRRVDTSAFRMQGYAFGYLHPLRCVLQRFAPQRRERVYRALCGAAAGIVQENPEALLRAIEGVSPRRLAVVAQKHRMDALLCDALAPLQEHEYAKAVHGYLSRARWSATAYAAAYREQVLDVLRLLQSAGVETVLLKGATRAFLRDGDWELHQSSDIDVLVERDDVGRARAALERAGYAARCDEALEEFYRTRHHHAAPLYPQGAGVPIEIHHALYPTMLQSTTLRELREHVVYCESDGLRAGVLNDVATAAHLAIHDAERAILRDVVLLARILRGMSDGDRAAVIQVLNDAGADDVRTHGVLALAAQLAGVSWEAGAQVGRFVQWMQQREDLPRPLRARPHCIDAWLAARGSRVRALLRAIAEGVTPRARVARAAAGAVSAAYLFFMR